MMLKKIKTAARYAAIVFVFLGLAGYALIMNHSGVQDRLVKRALTAQFGSVVDDFGGDKIDIVFCGTASPMGGAGPRGAAQSCVAVFAGDKFFLVDTGARSADKAIALGLPMQRLSAVLLTHFHSDHIAALGEVHLNSWVRGRPDKLRVYGGPGIEQVVNGFNLAYGLDYRYRADHHGEAYTPSKNAGLVAQPIIADSVIYDEDGLKITAITVSHPPIEPALAFRFDYAGRSVLISGDTVKDDNLIEAARNVDVLIHEVLQPDLVKTLIAGLAENGQPKLAKIIDDTLDYHTTPVEAAEAANLANADLLVFYHYAPMPQNAVMDRIYMRGVAELRPEGVLAALEGTRVTLPSQGDSIIIAD
ncbi:MAG: MBL fold metallo-hydrolase [Alphaproteobacteria bacterium]|nr:MBL fold metallo-hydrolase [Alphaproteobacteria bacterium]